jgi:hypothetical protein
MEDMPDDAVQAYVTPQNARLRTNGDFKHLGSLCVCQIRDCVHPGGHGLGDFSYPVRWILHFVSPLFGFAEMVVGYDLHL